MPRRELWEKRMAEQLRRLRQAAGLSQAKLADLAKVSVWLVRRWEQTGRTPLFGTVLKVADALGVSLDELAGRQPPAGAAKGRKKKGE
jgi:transcriptional regulator with XRE-family HTH domain